VAPGLLALAVPTLLPDGAGAHPAPPPVVGAGVGVGVGVRVVGVEAVSSCPPVHIVASNAGHFKQCWLAS
jgi:hypothetical protein